jgi:hypothetical protein
MAILKNVLTLWSSLGDVIFNSQQAGAIGASFGNGAATAGTNPNNPNQMGDDGNIAVDNPAVARSPSATTLDKILSLMTIPANGFDIANRQVQVFASGNAPNGNAKTLKIIINPTSPVLGATVSGGTTIASFTSSATGGWQIGAILCKYGITGSNTQNSIHESAQIGGTVGALVAPSQTTFPENAPITVAITGNASTTTADVTFNFGQTFAMN